MVVFTAEFFSLFDQARHARASRRQQRVSYLLQQQDLADSDPLPGCLPESLDAAEPHQQAAGKVASSILTVEH